MTNAPMEEPEGSYLEGKVFKITLPQVQGQPPPGTPRLKRLTLPQGELAQLHDSDQALHYLAAIELREGKVRGNHYHKIREELVYLLSGELVLSVEDIETHRRASVSMRGGDYVVIQSGVAHAMKPLSAGVALEFAAARFDPGDTYKFPLA